MVHLNKSFADKIGLAEGARVKVQQQDSSTELDFVIDNRIADQTVLIHAGHPDTAELGFWFSEVTIGKV